jgi:hypothetical protein
VLDHLEASPEKLDPETVPGEGKTRRLDENHKAPRGPVLDVSPDLLGIGAVEIKDGGVRKSIPVRRRENTRKARSPVEDQRRGFAGPVTDAQLKNPGDD